MANALASLNADSLYGDVLSAVPGLTETYQRMKRSPEYRSLRDELAMVRAMMAQYLSILATYDRNDNRFAFKVAAHMRGTLDYVETIRRLVESISDLEMDFGANVNVEQVTLVLNKVVEVVEAKIQDPMILDAIAADLDKLSWPSGGTVNIEPLKPAGFMPKPAGTEAPGYPGNGNGNGHNGSNGNGHGANGSNGNGKH